MFLFYFVCGRYRAYVQTKTDGRHFENNFLGFPRMQSKDPSKMEDDFLFVLFLFFEIIKLTLYFIYLASKLYNITLFNIFNMQTILLIDKHFSVQMILFCFEVLV